MAIVADRAVDERVEWSTATLPGVRAERLELALAWIGVASAAAIVVFAATGSAIAAVLASVAVLWVRRWPVTRAVRADAAARTDAIVSWTETLGDEISGSAGLEQALVVSAMVGPEAIRPELRGFVASMDQVATVDALARLRVDLNHRSADMAVLALASAARMEARESASLVGRLDELVRTDADRRLRVEVGRLRNRRSAIIAVTTTLIAVGSVVVFVPSTSYVFSSAAGLAGLLLLGGGFAAGVWLLCRDGRV